MNIDFEGLRSDLISYFGTAAQVLPAMYLEISRVEIASNEELLQIAYEYEVNVENYKVLGR